MISCSKNDICRWYAERGHPSTNSIEIEKKERNTKTKKVNLVTLVYQQTYVVLLSLRLKPRTVATPSCGPLSNFTWSGFANLNPHLCPCCSPRGATTSPCWKQQLLLSQSALWPWASPARRFGSISSVWNIWHQWDNLTIWYDMMIWWYDDHEKFVVLLAKIHAQEVVQDRNMNWIINTWISFQKMNYSEKSTGGGFDFSECCKEMIQTSDLKIILNINHLFFSLCLSHP